MPWSYYECDWWVPDFFSLLLDHSHTRSYPPVDQFLSNYHQWSKWIQVIVPSISPFKIGRSTTNGSISIVMLVYQRVINHNISSHGPVKKIAAPPRARWTLTSPMKSWRRSLLRPGSFLRRWWRWFRGCKVIYIYILYKHIITYIYRLRWMLN